jgi:hypothetical protein
MYGRGCWASEVVKQDCGPVMPDVDKGVDDGIIQFRNCCICHSTTWSFDWYDMPQTCSVDDDNDEQDSELCSQGGSSQDARAPSPG